MRLIITIVFAAAIVGFATIGHHIAKPNVIHVPATAVAPELCEHHPFKHGWVSQAVVYADDSATLHIQCGDGTWITADR